MSSAERENIIETEQRLESAKEYILREDNAAPDDKILDRLRLSRVERRAIDVGIQQKQLVTQCSVQIEGYEERNPHCLQTSRRRLRIPVGLSQEDCNLGRRAFR